MRKQHDIEAGADLRDSALSELTGETAYGKPSQGHFLTPETPWSYLKGCRPAMLGQVGRGALKWAANNVAPAYATGLVVTHDFVQAIAKTKLGNDLDHSIISFSLISSFIFFGFKASQEALVKPFLHLTWNQIINCACGLKAEKYEQLGGDHLPGLLSEDRLPIVYNNPNRLDLRWFHAEMPWGNKLTEVSRAMLLAAANTFLICSGATYVALKDDQYIFDKTNPNVVRIEFNGGLYPVFAGYFAIMLAGAKVLQEMLVKPFPAAIKSTFENCVRNRHEASLNQGRGYQSISRHSKGSFKRSRDSLTRDENKPLTGSSSAFEQDALQHSSSSSRRAYGSFGQ